MKLAHALLRFILVCVPLQSKDTEDTSKNKNSWILPACSVLVIGGILSLYIHHRSDSIICEVCLEEKSHWIALQPCGHRFCRVCIIDWKKRFPYCPKCRSNIQ